MSSKDGRDGSLNVMAGIDKEIFGRSGSASCRMCIEAHWEEGMMGVDSLGRMAERAEKDGAARADNIAVAMAVSSLDVAFEFALSGRREGRDWVWRCPQ